MADFTRQDLAGSRFEQVDLTGARFRNVDLTHAVIRGALLVNVDIDGLLQDVTVNGVDVVPLVEAELNRRYHRKAKVRKLTHRHKGRSLRQMIEPLNQYLCGWRGYFGQSQWPWELRSLDEWIRRRLRC